jgi:hypothetical protein
MTLLEDLERHSEDIETQEAKLLKSVLTDLEMLLPEKSGTDNKLSHPGSTLEPVKLVFLSEAFVA